MLQPGKFKSVKCRIQTYKKSVNENQEIYLTLNSQVGENIGSEDSSSSYEGKCLVGEKEINE